MAKNTTYDIVKSIYFDFIGCLESKWWRIDAWIKVYFNCEKAILASGVGSLELSAILGSIAVLMLEVVFSIRIKSVMILLKPWINCQ